MFTYSNYDATLLAPDMTTVDGGYSRRPAAASEANIHSQVADSSFDKA